MQHNKDICKFDILSVKGLHTTVHRHMKTADVFHYVNAKIPEISLGSSDQNIRDHLGQPKIF